MDSTSTSKKQWWGDLPLKWKQVLLFLFVGMVPLIVVSVINSVSFTEIKNINAGQLQSVAEGIADKIDRNLFERYGDVQAFGLNTVIHNRELWYQPDSPIVARMNNYVDTYDIYYLTLLVDLEGKVIAVNTKDQDGAGISTDHLYQRNFRDSQWFKDVMNEKFYTSQKGNIGGQSDFTGTVIVPLHVNEMVKKSYPGDDGLTLGFAAPVYDEDGSVIAIWHNYAKLSLVEEIFITSLQGLDKKGLGNSELTLMNEKGEIIVDYDPAYQRGTESSVPHDLNILMKLNLADKGVKAAVGR